MGTRGRLIDVSWNWEREKHMAVSLNWEVCRVTERLLRRRIGMPICVRGESIEAL